jgi:putative thioredoxin
VPVVLDMWAEWCEPCKQLSPILERLANADSGSWVLAKIDTDANPRIAQALQVQGIPAVFAVIGGQLIPGFQGALAEGQVREFIDAVLAAAKDAGLSGAAAAPATDEEPHAEPNAEPAEEPDDPRFTAAEEALDAGDFDLAAQRYQAIVEQEPANTEAAFALGQVRLLQRIDTIDRDAAARADSSPDDVDAQLAAADLSLASNDVQSAFDRLLAAVARMAGDERERVRTRLLEYFDLLGPDDPRVSAARRQLARALF